jgi:hypothetical protein
MTCWCRCCAICWWTILVTDLDQVLDITGLDGDFGDMSAVTRTVDYDMLVCTKNLATESCW